MAKTVERPITSRTRRSKYPIHEWVGEIEKNAGELSPKGNPLWLKLEQGKDFDCSPTSLGSLLRQRVNKLNLKLKVEIDGDTVYAWSAGKMSRTEKETAKRVVATKKKKAKAKASA